MTERRPYPMATVHVTIGKHSLMDALISLTINNRDFRHEAWSLHDAEILEWAAVMIREGYRQTHPELEQGRGPASVPPP